MRADTSILFFFNDPATTEIYPLSLHDALPISISEPRDAAAAPTGTGPAVRRLTAAALHELLRDAGSPVPRLIDVREPYEYQAGHLAGAIHIPLGELPGRLAEVAPAGTAVFICRSGGRRRRPRRVAHAAGGGGGRAPRWGGRAPRAPPQPPLSCGGGRARP